MARVAPPLLLVAALLGSTPARADDGDVPVEHEGTTNDSPKYEGYAKDGVAQMPIGIRRVVAKAGFRVVLTPTLSWAEPGMTMVHLYGNLKPGNGTFVGLCQPGKHRVLVPEQFEKPDGSMTPITHDGVVGTIRHEMGHAFDSALGNVSKQALFKAAHEQDVAAMPQEMRDKHRYIISGPSKAGPVVPNASGRGETFADLVRVLTTPAAKRAKRDLELLALFPRCRGVVGTLDESLRRE